MGNATFSVSDENWNDLRQLLPDGWQEQAWKKKAFIRKSEKFPTEESLLRTLLIYITDNSFRKTAAICQAADITSVSDAALIKRLKNSSEWMRWMANEIIHRAEDQQQKGSRKFILADATHVKELGANGVVWRIHFSFDLNTMRCTGHHVSDNKTAESFANFIIEPGSVHVGDIAYARHSSISHVIQNHGDVLVRISPSQIKLFDERSDKINILKKFSDMASGEFAECRAHIKIDDMCVPVRLAAYRKTVKEAEKARKRVRRKSQKSQNKIRPETLLAAEYVFVITTIDRDMTTEMVLQYYRARWQIELYIKRLKSLISFKQLRNRNEKNVRAWLQGKMLVAVLAQTLMDMADHFFSCSTKRTKEKLAMEKI